MNPYKLKQYFEISVGHSGKDVQQTVGDTSLEFKEETQLGDRELSPHFYGNFH